MPLRVFNRKAPDGIVFSCRCVWLHFQVEGAGEGGVVAGEGAVAVGDSQRVLAVSHVAAGEEPQGALGGGILNGDDASESANGQGSEGSSLDDVLLGIGGRDERQRAVIAQQARSALNELAIGECASVAGLGACVTGWQDTVGEVGWVRDYKVIAFSGLQFVEVPFDGSQSFAPWRGFEVERSLLDGIMIDIDGIDDGTRVALGYHQGDDATSRPHIQHVTSPFCRAPCAQQDPVGAHLHRRTVIDHGKLLEPKNLLSSHNYLQR